MFLGGIGLKQVENNNQQLIKSTIAFAKALDALRFSPPITHIYNPFCYAWKPHELYLKKYARPFKEVVFLGMNPGPWGMAQTGIPFGEVNAVRDWLGITAEVEQPLRLHPDRPITGFNCKRSEVSGRRLWGLFKERFHTAEIFFKDHFVANYCPLLFYNAQGQNITPNKLKGGEKDMLFERCDQYFRVLIDILQPEWVVGVGIFAQERATEALEDYPMKITRIPHPSPANPAANGGWAPLVSAILLDTEMWT